MSEGGGELVFRWYLIVSSATHHEGFDNTYDRRICERVVEQELNCNQCRKTGTGPMYPYPYASRCSVIKKSSTVYTTSTDTLVDLYRVFSSIH